jgi:hypothetical protein
MAASSKLSTREDASWLSRRSERFRSEDGVDGAGVDLARAQQLLLRSRDGNEHGVILILPLRGLPLAGEHADHRQRDLLDANHLTDRVSAAEEVLRDRLPEQHHLGGAIGVGLR